MRGEQYRGGRRGRLRVLLVIVALVAAGALGAPAAALASGPVTTDAATSVGWDSAQLNGTSSLVDPEGYTCTFRYSTNIQFTANVVTVPAVQCPLEGDTFDVEIYGLSNNTPYYVEAGSTDTQGLGTPTTQWAAAMNFQPTAPPSGCTAPPSSEAGPAAASGSPFDLSACQPTGLSPGVYTATLQGYVNPNGDYGPHPTEWAFEYSTSSDFANPSYSTVQTITGAPASEVMPDSVSATVSTAQSTEYYYRIGAENSSATANDTADFIYGATQTFVSEGPPTGVTTNDATPGWDSAQLNGTLTLNSGPTTLDCGFNVSSSPTLSSGVQLVGASCGGTGAFTTEIYGLSQSQTLYYQAQANVDGTIYKGSIESFTTGTTPSGCTTPPSSNTQPVSDGAPYDLSACPATVASNSITMNGYVNPNGTNTEFAFEYSTSPTFANPQFSTISYTSGAPGDTSDSIVPVAESATVDGLVPETTYYFRIGAENSDQTSPDTAAFSYGSSLQFTTGPPAPPACSDVDVTVVANTPSTPIQLDCNGYQETYQTPGTPSHGSLSDFSASAGTVVYTPATGYTGTDSFTYSASNAGGGPVSATVNITVVQGAAVTTGAASGVGETAATLNGSLSVGAGTTYSGATCSFQYSTSSTFSSGVTTIPAGGQCSSAAGTNSQFAAQVSGLSADTSYFYRAVVDLGGTTFDGTTVTFFTENPSSVGLKPNSCVATTGLVVPVGTGSLTVSAGCVLGDGHGDYVIEGNLILSGLTAKANAQSVTPNGGAGFDCTADPTCQTLENTYDHATVPAFYIDAKQQLAGSNSSYTLAAGSIPLSTGQLQGVSIAGGGLSDEDGKGLSLLGFTLEGTFQVQPDGSGGSTVTLWVQVPSVPKLVPGGFEGKVELGLNAQGQVMLNDLTVKLPTIPIGPLSVSGATLTYDGSTDVWTGSGSATIPDLNYNISVMIEIKDNDFKEFSGSVSGLEIPVPGADGAAFVTSLGLNFGVDPLTFGGSIGMTAGPSILGQSAASINASFEIALDSTQTVGPIGDILPTATTFQDVPFAFDLQGKLTLIGYIPIASANLDLLAGTGFTPLIAFSGGLGPLGGPSCTTTNPGGCTPQGFDVSVGGVHIITAKAEIDALIEGAHLNLEGSGQLSLLNLPGISGKVLISTKGFAACASLFSSLGLASDTGIRVGHESPGAARANKKRAAARRRRRLEAQLETTGKALLSLTHQVEGRSPAITRPLTQSTRKLEAESASGVRKIAALLNAHKITQARAIAELQALRRRVAGPLARLKAASTGALNTLERQSASRLHTLQARFNAEYAALVADGATGAGAASLSGPWASSSGCFSSISAFGKCVKGAADAALNYVKNLGKDAATTLEGEAQTFWSTVSSNVVGGATAFYGDVTSFGNLLSTDLGALAQDTDALLGTVGQGIEVAGVEIAKGAETALEALEKAFDGEVGVSFDWGGAPHFFEGSCDLSSYADTITVSRDARAAAAGQKVNLQAGASFTVLRIQGQGAPPLVTVDGPGALHVVMPTGVLGGMVDNGHAFVLRDPTTDTTFVEFQPQTGAYTVSPDPGSAPITEIQHANSLPVPVVTAQVLGTGRRRTLQWSARAIPGQQIMFSSVGSGGAQVITTTSAASGRVSFRPPIGAPGERTVVAEILENGETRTSLEVASFPGPVAPIPRPPAPLKFKRTSTSVLVSWPRSNTAIRDFIVHVAISDGRRLTYEPTTPSVSIGGVLPSSHLTVTVQTVGATGLLSPTIKQSLAAVKKPAKTPTKKRHKKK